MPGNWRQYNVGTTAVLVLGANKNRLVWNIYNLSQNLVYWEHSPNVTTNSGPIAQYQAIIEQETDGDLTHEPVYMIAATATNDVRVYEETGVAASFRKVLESR